MSSQFHTLAVIISTDVTSGTLTRKCFVSVSGQLQKRLGFHNDCMSRSASTAVYN
jgi:hypothetical protein